MVDFTSNFEFAEFVKLDDCLCWYFTGDKSIINSLFPNKYPDASFTTLSIEKYADDDWLVSISPTIEGDDECKDYDWSDIELSMNTINALISKSDC